MSQEKLQTIIMQNFGGQKRCIMGFVQVENSENSTVNEVISQFNLLASKAGSKNL